VRERRALEQEMRMAEKGNIHAVTDATFADEVEKASGLTLIDFWAVWCGPCRMVAPIVEQLAQEYSGKLKVLKLDVDNNMQTSARFNIRSIPSLLFFKDGKLVDTVVGAVPRQFLERKVQEHLAA
jgi:thioredoxin 1